jgi:hypothetical protein
LFKWIAATQLFSLFPGYLKVLETHGRFRKFACCDNFTVKCTVNYSTNFYVRNILESNPRPVRCDWKTFMQLNENRVIYKEREYFYVWKPSESNSGILHLQCRYNRNYMAFSNSVKFRIAIRRNLFTKNQTFK